MPEPFHRRIAIGSIDTGYKRRATVTVEINYDGRRLSITGDARRAGAADIDQGGQMQETIAEMTADELGWSVEARDELLELWNRWHLNDMRPECEHQRELGWRELAGREVTIYHWRLAGDVVEAVRRAIDDAVKVLRTGEPAQLDPEVASLARLPREMTTATETPPSPVYVPAPATTYSRPTETKLLGWLCPSEHPEGILTKPCPTCGYRYGSEWRKQEVPAEVLERLESLPD